MTLVDQAALIAPLEEVPDGVVVLVGKGVVVVAPIHPVAKPDRLFGLAASKGIDTLFTTLHEVGDAVLFDLALVVQAQFLLNLDLDPEALAVKAILVTL